MLMSIRFVIIVFGILAGASHAGMTEQVAAVARTSSEVANADKVTVAKKAIEGAVGKEVGAVINRQIDAAAKQEAAKEVTPTNAERAQAEEEVAAEEKAEQLCRACKAAKGAKNCPCAFMEAADKKQEEAAEPSEKKEENASEGKKLEEKKEKPVQASPEHKGEAAKPGEKTSAAHTPPKS